MSPSLHTTPSLASHISQRAAISQGELISGADPVEFMTSNPLRLWLIQAGVIIVTSQLFSLGLRRLRQPRVIAELLAGILLGPTALGRIPGFTERIFPSVSIPYLSLVADIGLCLFFFLVGLEIDIITVKCNLHVAAIVSLSGIAVPFALSSALSVPLYYHFIDPSVRFIHVVLFTGLACSVTAFAVVCRVLTELKLLNTSVGTIVLSAGVCNEVLAWTLLALCVALVNASSELSALWILLVCVAFIIILLFPVRFVFLSLARNTGSTENGPTMFYMTAVMILLWSCAFFADSIGVNAIFGALVAGLVVPREGDLAIALTEKLEDMVSIVFLPLYFALSGLHTDLGLLDNGHFFFSKIPRLSAVIDATLIGITWAFTIAIIVVAYSGKLGASMITSRMFGYGWRESGTIGALMSCKGLMDLVVLNVALQAGVLSQRVFSMFVLEAVVVTLTITPLVMALYPPELRVRVCEALPHVRGDADHGDASEKALSSSVVDDEYLRKRQRLTMVLSKLDHVPSAMALLQLFLAPRSPSFPPDALPTDHKPSEIPISDVSVQALRLVELSEGTLMMMTQSSSSTDGSVVPCPSVHPDHALDIFETFGELNDVAMTTSLTIVPFKDFAESVAEHAQRHGSQLVLFPCVIGSALVPAAQASGGEEGVTPEPRHNLFDGAAARDGGLPVVPPIHLLQPTHAHSPSCALIYSMFARCSTAMDVAVLVSDDIASVDGGSDPVYGSRGMMTGSLDLGLGFSSGSGSGRGEPVHIFLPFFGGADDRLALELVIQLCVNPRTTATIVRMVDQRGDTGARQSVTPNTADFAAQLGVIPNVPSDSTVSTATRVLAESADDMVWAKYTDAAPMNTALYQTLLRIRFSDADMDCDSGQVAVRHAHMVRNRMAPASRLLVVVGRSRPRQLAPGSRHQAEIAFQGVEPGHHILPHTPHVNPAQHHRHWWASDGIQGMQRAIGDVGTAMFIGSTTNSVLVVQAAAASTSNLASG